MSCFCKSVDLPRSFTLPTLCSQVTPDELKELLSGLGAPLQKVSETGKVSSKKLQLSHDGKALHYYPSVKQRQLASTAVDVIVSIKKVLCPKKPARLPLGQVGLAIQRTGGSTWNFLVPTADADTWIDVLSDVTGVRTRQSNALDPQQQRAIKLWRAADSDGDGLVTKDEFIHCLSRINYTKQATVNQCLALFHRFVEDDSEHLDYIGFSALYASIARRCELKDVFDAFARSYKGAMLQSEFREFLQECQADFPSAQGLRNLFSVVARAEKMSYDAFSRFLLRPDLNPALAPWATFVHDDMNHPMSHYFVNTWHMHCDSSDGMATLHSAVVSGCKSFQLDCVDGPDNEPHIYSTSNLDAAKVFDMISNFGFEEPRDYPVLLKLRDKMSVGHAMALREMLKVRNDIVQLRHDELMNRTPSSLRKKIVVELVDASEDGRVKHEETSPLPTAPWSKGLSAVHSQFDSWREPLRINDGFFSLNGRCGYVLKPQHLQEFNSTLSPPNCKYQLSVTVMLGNQLPKGNDDPTGPVIDPFIKIKLHGVAEDESEPEQRTKTVSGNGFDPVWNEQFKVTVHNIELALLSVRVVDSCTPKILQGLVGARGEQLLDTEVCEAVVPVRALRRGYRSVGLRLCSSGEYLPAATVLCHFDIEKI